MTVVEAAVAGSGISRRNSTVLVAGAAVAAAGEASAGEAAAIAVAAAVELQ